MRPDHTDLWNRLQAFEFDDPDSDFTFTDRLARENDWSINFTIRVIEEYRRFLFLICTTDHPLTPSDQVDQAWHLHLLYTQSYWTDLCKHTLGKEIHHGPTKGGQQEKDKYNNWYEETKLRYSETFNQNAPEDIWPPAHIRFGELKFTRVNRHRFWIVPKPKIRKK